MKQKAIFGFIVAAMLAVVLARPAAGAQVDARERLARTSCLSGDYVKGVALLSELFVDTRNPTFVYNQGRCFEQNHRYEDAISRFQEYLRVGRTLGEEEKSDAKKHIADCQELLAQANQANRPQPAPPPIPESPGPVAAQPTVVVAQPAPSHMPGRGLRIAGIVVGAGGVAAVVAGILFGVKANSLASDMEKLNGYSPDKESSRKTYETLGWIGYGVGAACIATGGVLYFLGARAGATETPRAAFAPIIAPDQAGVAIRGAF
jgi:hypothetical protein